ncbi:MAG TPA: histidine kinase [Vicinamibacterales bacterium]
MPPLAGLIVDLAGYLTGMALYVMLAVMVWRERAREGASFLARRGWLPLVTGLCGFVWNLGALTSLVFEVAGGGRPSPAIVAVAFAALGFLPAVVVHALFDGRETGASRSVGRTVIGTSYALSAIAAILHFVAAARGLAVPSRPALWLLTIGFVGLMLLLLVITREQAAERRGTWVVALAVFALSALHFERHVGNEAWWIELVGHHASLPLALAILIQDYRFAFADLFLKSAIALLLLVSLSIGACLGIIVPLAGWHDARGLLDPRATAAMVIVWVATATAFPFLRRVAGWLVDRVVLHRPDYELTLTSFVDGLEEIVADDDVMASLSDAVSAAVGATGGHTVIDPFAESDRRVVVTGTELRGLEAPASLVLRLRTVEPPQPAIAFGALTAGRRLLSDDVRLLESMARWAARRIDSIRVARERLARDLREGDMRRLATEAELRALRAQLNPHFLFNALTTIGYLMEAAPSRAIDALMRLTSLLRGVLRRSATELSTLGEEIDLVAAYLDLEKARFEERLTVGINVPIALRSSIVPTLILQPIVENAIKHGLSQRLAGGSVRIQATADRGRLAITVEDSGGGFVVTPTPRPGLGLRHVTDRLRALYGTDARLDIRSSEVGTIVTIELPERAARLDAANLSRRRIG